MIVALDRALQRRVLIDAIGTIVTSPQVARDRAITLGFTLVIFMLFNFVILFGPLVFMGIQQIKTYEPGDADWGVKLDDVRGQLEAKEEITRVVSLWQSGEEFEKAGGKRERGVLFLGPPGTGKTMLSKAIATSFNCPFVTIPGSGFAQTFIGMDAVIVRFLARKAKKHGRQVGRPVHRLHRRDRRRRHAPLVAGHGLRAAGDRHAPRHQLLRPDGRADLDGRPGPGDRGLARQALRRARRTDPPALPGDLLQDRHGINGIMPGGMMGMGGGLALNQLLVVMDGIDDPPFMKRVRTRKFNTFLDALYIVPQRLFGRKLAPEAPKPRQEEVYFIGACNAPLEALDPALTRPGRMGRHIYFRTPTWEDRRDIFDLYLGKVSHEHDLDTPKRATSSPGSRTATRRR